MADKSALYPRVSWKDCLEFVKTVASFNLKSVAFSEICKKYGLANPTTKSFTSRISSCKQFGLITSSGNVVQLTDTCKRILYPTGDSVVSIERACFVMPPLYNKLIAIYDGKAIPSEDKLANILMQDHRIQKNAKDIAARVFIESANQLGLICGGILCYSESEDNDKEKQSTYQQANEEHLDDALNSVESNNNSNYDKSTTSESDYITQTIPFESGKIARFSIPVDASEDDLLLLKDMLDVILRRKFKLNS